MFTKFLNTSIETSEKYDGDYGVIPEQTRSLLIDKTIKRIRPYSLEIELQFWSDVLGNLLSDSDSIDEYKKMFR